MKRTGAQLVWEILREEGVRVVFGIPGGSGHGGFRTHSVGGTSA